jgi:L-fuculose-phosphate aldolase
MEEKNKINPVKFETVFLDSNLPNDKRINELIYWSKKFDKLGLTPNSAGNLSFRTENGFIISGTGVELKNIKKQDFVEVLRVQRTMKGRIFVFAKGKAIPSKESLLHEVIYNLRPEINAIFHCHDKVALEFADKLDMPRTKKEQPPGSEDLVEEVRILLNSKKTIKYFFLKNHGIVSMGKNREEAGERAEFVHAIAQDIKKWKGEKK